MTKLKKHKFQNHKYKIKLEEVSAKRKETSYADTLPDAKKEVKTMLYASPSGVARIEVLKKDGRTYKSGSSYKWVKDKKTDKKKISKLYKKKKSPKMKKKVRDFTPKVYGLWNDRVIGGKKFKPWSTIAYRSKKEANEFSEKLEKRKPIKVKVIPRKVKSSRSGKSRNYYIPYWRKNNKK